MIPDVFDAIVIGAGPAGMAAATELAGHGASTLLVDEQAQPGGQIYRAAESCGNADADRFGKSYLRGRDLIATFRSQPIDYRPETTVVNITDNFAADIVGQDRLSRVSGDVLIVAAGAYERPLAIPGWTLPGVMTAGAGQILAKQSGIVPSGRIIVAGTGPLIWLLAWQYARMGVRIEAIVTVEADGNFRNAARHLAGFLGSVYVRDGLKYLATAYRTTRIVRARRLRGIQGEKRATGLVLEGRDGRNRTIEADTILLHNGVQPNVNLAGGLGCDLVWNGQQRCWETSTDEWQRTSRHGIYMAGDGSAIAGARVAECSGRIAAVDALWRLGRLARAERDATAAPWAAERDTHLRGRAFVDALYSPVDTMGEADADTMVCRCEGVTLAAVETVLRNAEIDSTHVSARLNHLKAMTRCGMGSCQGRNCWPSITALMASRLGVDPILVGPPSHRFPTKPLALDALAGFSIADAADGNETGTDADDRQ